jgi:peroxiredoxin Q/BCP
MRIFLLTIVLLVTPALAQQDFTAPAVAAPFKLSEARGSFVALHFLLKTECPFCLKHTRTYVERAAETPGVVHVFLKPDAPAEIQKWLGDVKPPEGTLRPVIYQDAGAKIADQFKIPGGYKFHGQTMHYPALIVIDRDGNEAFRYVGKSNTDRYSFDLFAAKVAELGGNKRAAATTAPTEKSGK